MVREADEPVSLIAWLAICDPDESCKEKSASQPSFMHNQLPLFIEPVNPIWTISPLKALIFHQSISSLGEQPSSKQTYPFVETPSERGEAACNVSSAVAVGKRLSNIAAKPRAITRLASMPLHRRGHLSIPPPTLTEIINKTQLSQN